MHARVEELGGRLTVTTADGTRVRAELPATPTDARAATDPDLAAVTP